MQSLLWKKKHPPQKKNKFGILLKISERYIPNDNDENFAIIYQEAAVECLPTKEQNVKIPGNQKQSEKNEGKIYTRTGSSLLGKIILVFFCD